MAGESDQLTYLDARVWPLGSSQIEQRAARLSGDSNWSRLEELRQLKEDGCMDYTLANARDQIGCELREDTVTPLFRARQKLDLKLQLNDLRMMFGGGGHVKNPYEKQVLDALKDCRVFGKRPPVPDIVGMPLPTDLEPSDSISRWMPRLWIAYGLSFPRDELAGHMYPSEVSEGRSLESRREVDFVRQEDV